MESVLQTAINLEALKAQRADYVRRGFHTEARMLAAQIRQAEAALGQAVDDLTPEAATAFFVDTEVSNG